MKKVIVFGTGDIAELVKYYFETDSDYQIAAFFADDSYAVSDQYLGYPLEKLSTIQAKYPPNKYSAFVAIGYSKMNKVRSEKYHLLKSMGYNIVSYVSSRATVFDNAVIGEGCFILENNVVQPFVSIGDNTVLWSGNHIGHHSKIGSHCFITSHVVVSGKCCVKDYCFLGVNATISSYVTVDKNTFVNAGALIVKSTSESEVYGGHVAVKKEITSEQLKI